LIADEDKAHSQPVQFVGWVAIPSLTILFWVALYFIVFGFLCKYSYGRKLLLNHPKLFTKGVFSHEGPTKEQLQNTSVVVTLTAKGRSQKAFDAGTVKEPDTTAGTSKSHLYTRSALH
jgi:hypothetical protein